MALCLERLFLAIKEGCLEKNPIIHHYALKNIIEIIKLTEKPELKSRFIKELMRIEHGLKKAQLHPSNSLYEDVFLQIQILSHLSGRFGDIVHHNPFLQSIRLAQSSHNIESESSYSPQLLLWLENDYQIRQNDLKSWLNDLTILYNSVQVYLDLLRENAVFESINMFNGFYQRSLASHLPCQLILLSIDKKSHIIPKMQLGHHSLNIRLCDPNTLQEVRHVEVGVQLAICYL